MVNRTLTDEIITIIKDHSNNNPAPTLATITDINTPNRTITINLENTTIPNIPYIGTPVIGNKCILVFIDGSTEQPYAIT